MILAALSSCSVSSSNECSRIIKVPRQDLRNTMNPALNKKFHLFCEQEHPQRHANTDKNPYCVYGTLKREPGRDERILKDHRQDGNVAIGGIGNLAR